LFSGQLGLGSELDLDHVFLPLKALEKAVFILL
jgi:hypothetical protein